VTKQSNKGLVLRLENGLTAVAPLQLLPPSVTPAALVNVRILNFDASVGCANVTLDPACASRAPSQLDDILRFSAEHPAGSRVPAVVVLVGLDGEATVEIAAGSFSMIGVLVPDPFTGSVNNHPPLRIGDTIEGTVEYVPPSSALVRLAPFVVVSLRSKPFQTVPKVRLGGPSSPLVGPFPWRDQREEYGSDGHSHEVGEKLKKRRLEEAIDALERQEMTVPKSPDEFRKLLLATPNSSFLWTHFMAYHVSLQQIEEARQIAEQALRTIGVRESSELLNVWVAYMNLENAHGTAESLSSIFRRAVAGSDDTLIVHTKLADIFAASKKHQQLLALCRAMVSKFSEERGVWQRLGEVLIDQDKRDQLKRMIKDMREKLKKDDQALVVVHLAIYDYRRGAVEAARNLFEALLLQAPKKSDVWSAYIDQEIGLLSRRATDSSVAHTRHVFERCVTVPFPAKVMQQLLTRFLAFEQQHGSPDDVEKVKERARAYVESKLGTSS
jgi:rRNA biogenesis protein RRP5